MIGTKVRDEGTLMGDGGNMYGDEGNINGIGGNMEWREHGWGMEGTCMG